MIDIPRVILRFRSHKGQRLRGSLRHCPVSEGSRPARDQDPLGRQAHIVSESDGHFVLAKEMEDGSMAVGLFSMDEIRRTVGVNWNQLGLSGKQRVRDLWRQTDVGVFEDRYEVVLPRHGVAMLRLWPSE